MRKRFLEILLCFTVLISLFPMHVYATQSRSYNFSKNYTLTGNYANDIVSVAKAQLGKTQSQLGYTEAWCANFATDCARLTGMPDNVIPYNYGSRGACRYLYSYMVNNCGAQPVSDRQAGDLIFYYCASCATYPHVGIVSDVTYSYEGNYSNKVSKVNVSSTHKCYHCGKITQRRYLRPNYGASPNPIPNPPDTNRTRVCLEAPTERSFTAYDDIEICGWVISDHDITAVTCTVNGEKIYPSVLDDRSDVTKAFPGYNYGGKGFYCVIPKSSLHYNKTNEIVIRALTLNNTVIVAEVAKLNVEFGWLPFRAKIEEPAETSFTTSEDISMYGWAIYESPFSAITYVVNGEVIRQCEMYDRNDVKDAFPGYKNGKEGFSATIPKEYLKEGNNEIIVRALLRDNTVLAGEVGRFNVNYVKIPDNTPPTIENVHVTDLSKSGYTLHCTVNDDIKLKSTRLYVWTEKDDQDDIKWFDSTEAGEISFRVNTSDHNNEEGNYKNHIYVYDAADNRSIATITVDIPYGKLLATPTPKPTATPTLKPTPSPTLKPTATPTLKPTPSPTLKPTATPTLKPTLTPTPKPTATPTLKPTLTPTSKPTVKPTPKPTTKPTSTPAPSSKPELNNRTEFVRLGNTVIARLVFENNIPSSSSNIHLIAAYKKNGYLQRAEMHPITDMTSSFIIPEEFNDCEIYIYLWDKNMEPLMQAQKLE